MNAEVIDLCGDEEQQQPAQLGESYHNTLYLS
jgi:hypothetical protein